VRKYVAAAEAAGMSPGGAAVSQERWAELARECFPELADTRLRQVTWPAIGEHRDYIVAQLEARVTVVTIHQRLADERGLAVSVPSLRRHVAANLPEEVRRAQVTVLSLYPAVAGEQAQVDYGLLGRWADPVTGRVRGIWAAAMMLCCSRYLFVRPVITMVSGPGLSLMWRRLSFSAGAREAGAGQSQDRGSPARRQVFQSAWRVSATSRLAGPAGQVAAAVQVGVVAGAFHVGCAQRVSLIGPVLKLGLDGEGGFDGQRGEGVDEQHADALVEAEAGIVVQIRRPLAMPSPWQT
jgi:hypothetical protein